MTLPGEGEACYYCGKPCDALTGNASLWPVALPHKDDPGVMKWHHVKCVSERLEREKDLENALLDAVAHLSGAVSAYKKHASRHKSVGRAVADPFYTTRLSDFEKAEERGHAALCKNYKDDK